MKRALVVMVVALQALVFNQVFAQKPEVAISNKAGWHKIGEVTASFKEEKDEISVMGKDKFKSLKLKVTDAPIDIEKATVYYESGETQDLSMNNSLQTGQETKTFDLKNTDGIKKVSFTYKTPPNAKHDKAHVELYGLK
jgi:hypothetical protein